MIRVKLGMCTLMMMNDKNIIKIINEIRLVNRFRIWGPGEKKGFLYKRTMYTTSDILYTQPSTNVLTRLNKWNRHLGQEFH